MCFHVDFMIEIHFCQDLVYIAGLWPVRMDSTIDRKRLSACNGLRHSISVGNHFAASEGTGALRSYRIDAFGRKSRIDKSDWAPYTEKINNNTGETTLHTAI
jgi:hypothetical protein